MYRTKDGQAFKTLDTLARTLTHRAPGTTWRSVDSGFDPYWVTIAVEKMTASGPRTVRTTLVPRAVFMTWLRERAPKVRVRRLRTAR